MMLNARSPTRWRKQEEGERAVQSWNKLFWGMGTLMSNTDKGTFVPWIWWTRCGGVGTRHVDEPPYLALRNTRYTSQVGTARSAGFLLSGPSATAEQVADAPLRLGA